MKKKSLSLVICSDRIQEIDMKRYIIYMYFAKYIFQYLILLHIVYEYWSSSDIYFKYLFI